MESSSSDNSLNALFTDINSVDPSINSKPSGHINSILLKKVEAYNNESKDSDSIIVVTSSDLVEFLVNRDLLIWVSPFFKTALKDNTISTFTLNYTAKKIYEWLLILPNFDNSNNFITMGNICDIFDLLVYTCMDKRVTESITAIYDHIGPIDVYIYDLISRYPHIFRDDSLITHIDTNVLINNDILPTTHPAVMIRLSYKLLTENKLLRKPIATSSNAANTSSFFKKRRL